jgi:hypothetical protein
MESRTPAILRSQPKKILVAQRDARFSRNESEG